MIKPKHMKAKVGQQFTSALVNLQLLVITTEFFLGNENVFYRGL